MAYPLTAWGLLLFVLPAFAAEDDTLPDPTRPPQQVVKAAETAGNKPVAAAVLQSVILRAGMKPAAIIAGERIELGGDYGGAKLVKITEREVVLEGPSGVEVLLLTPAAQKRAVKPEPAGKKKMQRETVR